MYIQVCFIMSSLINCIHTILKVERFPYENYSYCRCNRKCLTPSDSNDDKF